MNNYESIKDSKKSIDNSDKFNELEEYGKNHPFDPEKAKQLKKEFEARRDNVVGALAVAEQVSDLRDSEPIREGFRMEVARIEDAAAEGLTGFIEEDELARLSGRYDLIEKKRKNARDAQHSFEDRKNELLMSTDDIELPTGISIKETTDDIIANQIWRLQMEANSTSDPDKAINYLEKIQQLRDMRRSMASGVVDGIMDSVDKTQEMQDKISKSTVKGIKAPKAPTREETERNQANINESQKILNHKAASLNQNISDLEQSVDDHEIPTNIA